MTGVIWRRASGLLWLALAGLLPVVFLPDARYPFDPAKRDAFCILAVLQLILIAIRWVPARREAARRLSGAPILFPAALAAMLAAAGHALSPGRPPADALDTVLGAGLCVGLVLEPGLAPAGKMLAAMVGGTLLAAGYALVQFLGADPIVWRTGFAGGAPGSTYGNPLFLGDGLALAIPCAVAGIAACRGRLRVLAFAAACLLGIALLAAQARGAWIGCAAALAALGVGLAGRRWRGEGGARPWIAAGAILGVSAAVALSVPGPHNPGGGSVFRSAASLLRFRPSGIEGRALIWEATARMARDRPLAGWGQGGVRRQYGAYQAPLLSRPAYSYLPYHSTLHAHNDFLQALAERGVAGTGVLVWLVAAAMTALVRGRRPGIAALAAGCGLVAWIVDGVANGPLHLPPSSMQFWLLIGIAGRRARAVPADEGDMRLPRSAVLATAGVVAVLLCRPFARDILAECWFQSGSLAVDAGEPVEALYALDRADAFALEDRRHRFAAGTAWYALGNWEEAARAFGEDAERNPGAYSAWFNLGLAEWRAGRRGEARDALARALLLKPGDQGTTRLLRTVDAGKERLGPLKR